MIAGLRQQYRDARHHCSAFVLGPDRQQRRSNDDGEPAGTAGPPMLEALTGHTPTNGVADLSDVCAVVIRYFGGTLLGTGGLTRAYSSAVASALDGASFLTRSRMRMAALIIPTADMGRYLHAFRRAGYPVLGESYSESGSNVRVRLGIADDAGALAEAAELTARLGLGAHPLELGDPLWIDAPASPDEHQHGTQVRPGT